jgi:hypothetical protein
VEAADNISLCVAGRITVNGVVVKAYNKVVTSLIEIVKLHSSRGNEENQEKFHSLLLLFMKIFWPSFFFVTCRALPVHQIGQCLSC